MTDTPTTVYVPAPGSYLYRMVAKGSGVVGRPYTDNEFLVYYEGNLYDASNIRTWADRVFHASDRMAVNYPTTSKTIARESELVSVGIFTGSHVELGSNKYAQQQLLDWLDLDSIQDLEPELVVSHKIGRTRYD